MKRILQAVDSSVACTESLRLHFYGLLRPIVRQPSHNISVWTPKTMSNLALKLREGTKKAHTMAENTGFIACFLRGTVEKQSYRKLVANLYFVYSAMEDAMHQLKDHPVMGKMYFPELDRKASLESDLEFYYGATWKTDIKPSVATQDYVEIGRAHV